MAEYIEVNGRQIRVRPTETVSEVDKYGNFHRQPNHFTKGFGSGKIRSRKTGTFYSGQKDATGQTVRLLQGSFSVCRMRSKWKS